MKITIQADNKKEYKHAEKMKKALDTNFQKQTMPYTPEVEVIKNFEDGHSIFSSFKRRER